MPDNVKINEGLGPVAATDEIAGVHHQRVKLEFGADGAAADVHSGNPLPVTVSSSLPAGSSNIGQVDPRGNVAHDGIDSGNPVKVGGRARTALPAAVAQNDRVDMILDKFGRQLATVAPLDERLSATLNRTTAEAGQLLAALAEGAYVVTAVTITNASLSVSTKVELLDGETVKWRGYAIKEGGGFAISDPNGIFVGTKNTALRAKCATTGADVDFNVSVYKIPA